MPSRTFVFFPESAYGPTNNCVGIGDVLRRRGHRVVFIAEESFKGTLEAKGFEERLMRLSAPEEGAAEEDPGQFWKDFIRETAPVFRKPTIAQLEGFIGPTFQALCDGARYVDDRLVEIIGELEPDVIVEDNVVSFPALAASGVPWVRTVSCNPAEVKDADVPPPFSGYPVANRSGWPEYWAEYDRAIGPIQREFSEFCVERGAPPLPNRELEHVSPHMNLTIYPSEADYPRAVPLGPTWHNLEAAVRTTDDPWELPAELARREGPLVYLSLGSLGSADVALMKSLIATLADSRFRVIVSMGPQHEELELADNMAGAEFLPQTSILPAVDLVITHGGNNTVTESLRFGKPMVLLPLFWDQYDNAQRIHETGLGTRLSTYEHEPDELRGAIDRLLGDEELAVRLAEISARLGAAPGTEKAADLLERLAQSSAGD
jgi:MGT family glycosyltransferase